MKLLIMAANGQIARIVEDRVLSESAFKDVELTLFLRNSSRLSNLANNSRVTVVEGSLDNENDVNKAVSGQDMVFVAVVDHTSNNAWTKNVIAAMKANNVQRVVFTNILGLYDEVPGEFGRWNRQSVMSGLPAAINSDKLLDESGLDYTTLRLPWLNDRDEVKYVVTHKNDQYNGVSGSRQSIADVVLKIVADPTFGSKDSLGIADPATQGSDRPVY
ncbi:MULTISPECIES: NAD(P)H-binding protein [Pediococcus]|jgi:nucleoside-diphosphate-sugar epimerase|uniref:NAD(P)H-binding protein n=1 Tax=Pediococcus TaxID=1253 RepID=UPI00070BF88F|nr:MULTISPECIES: NAD(P)H-binding protein [Pediococcus]MCT3026549.1 oxidoreductase [Pediococcus parvulus]MCT3029882.1 oxidoreductase [Pediococcus parvulus]MCT3030679.1 oxidoreductase [Pediococcus parvulus]MCT3034279.1 oxidoreductase [Pediococcus parvulus]GEL89939.1 saccharopine dehydrogenase [Pediococcus parvulus]